MKNILITAIALAMAVVMLTAAAALSMVTVKEGDLVKLKIDANDPDSDSLTYTYSDPLDSKGQWQTERGDAGVYTTTVTVSDGEFETAEDVAIVVESINEKPVIEMESPITVTETEVVSLNPEVADANNDQVVIEYSGWMDSDSYQTVVGDEGTHIVTITADDGYARAKMDVEIIVLKLNRPPAIDISDVTVSEGEQIHLVPTVSDPDGDEVSLSYSGKMDSDTYQTTNDDAGTHTVTITASDGRLSSSVEAKITVNNVDRPPVVEVEERNYTISEGDTLTFYASAYDPDGEDFVFKLDGPEGASIDKGTFLWRPDYDTVTQDSEFNLTFTADNGMTASKTVHVLVKNVNRLPVVYGLEAYGPPIVGQTVVFVVTALDPDNDTLVYTWEFGAFDNFEDGPMHSRVFTSAGIKKIGLTVSDGTDEVGAEWEFAIIDVPDTKIVEYQAVNATYFIGSDRDVKDDPSIIVIRN